MNPIILLDDEANILYTLRLFLEDEGYIVATFSQGTEALDYLRTHPYPHIIITDYLMPGMKGDEFLDRAHTEFAAIHHCYLLIAARPPSQMPAEFIASLTSWQVPYIQKPFDIFDLLKQIGACQASP